MLTRKTITIALGVLSLGVIACENNKSSESANPSNNAPAPQMAPTTQAAPENPVTNTNAKLNIDPLTAAENKDKVKQYPDEQKFNPPRPARMITGFSAQVRESPAGEAMSMVETALPVNEIARDPKGDYFLVIYPDPKDGSKQLAGWVNKDALENTAWSQEASPEGQAGKPLAKTMATKLDCARGQAHIRTDRDFCAKSCKDDKGCEKSKGELCDGLGFEVHETTGKLTNIRYCISSAAPHAENEHGAEHGSSTPLDNMNKTP